MTLGWESSKLLNGRQHVRLLIPCAQRSFKPVIQFKNFALFQSAVQDASACVELLNKPDVFASTNALQRLLPCWMRCVGLAEGATSHHL